MMVQVSTAANSRQSQRFWQRGPWAYLVAALIVLVVTTVIKLFYADGNFASICMLYLLAVMATALFCGSLPAIASSILSFVAFNYFFVEPRFALTVKDSSEWLALCVFLLVATASGQLTAVLQARAEEASWRELQAATLAEAQSLAETNRLKTALLSMVSHDFRSPLTSIKASVGSLLDESKPWDNKTRRELLETIDEETDRLNRMVGNILDLSRLQADAWQPNCEFTPISELVGASLDSFTATENGRIIVSLENRSTEIWVDSVQLVQVLRNLLENALKYSAPETMVELKTHAEPQLFVIEVLDRGTGISPADQLRIYEPFYRSASVAESSIPGTGVGLAVSRGLIEAHGGRLITVNRPGGGSIFRIELPVTRKPQGDKKVDSD